MFAPAAAAAGGSSSSSRRRKHQQQREAPAAATAAATSSPTAEAKAAATAAAGGGSSKEQQASSKQSESKQKAATSVCPVERIMKYNISFINQRNTKIELFLGARPQNNEIVQLLKVVVMPNLNFFQAHGLPIQLLRADTT
jgi:3-oxoacyl-ACP reductase-like protein